MSFLSFFEKTKFLIISIFALIQRFLLLRLNIFQLLLVVIHFFVVFRFKKFVLKFQIIVFLGELLKLFFKLLARSFVVCSQFFYFLVMNFFQFFYLLLSIFSSIIAFSSFAFNSLDHLIMSFSRLIELRFDLLILNFFELKLLLVNGKFFVKHVSHAFQFFIFLFNRRFQLFFSLPIKFSCILEIKLKLFNVSTALLFELIHDSVHFIVLALTHCHIVFQISLAFFPLGFFKAIFLFNLIVR